jgi:hypothetical protein
MAGKLDRVRDEALRARLGEANRHLRHQRPTDAVRVVSDAFLSMLCQRPELLRKSIQMPNGLTIPLVMRWPMLGANLDPESVQAGTPRIDFVRDRFVLSEAITYYEFTVDTAIAEQL